MCCNRCRGCKTEAGDPISSPIAEKLGGHHAPSTNSPAEDEEHLLGLDGTFKVDEDVLASRVASRFNGSGEACDARRHVPHRGAEGEPRTISCNLKNKRREVMSA